MTTNRNSSTCNIGPLLKLQDTLFTAKQLFNEKMASRRAGGRGSSSLNHERGYFIGAEGRKDYDDDDEHEFEAKLNLFKSLRSSSIALTRTCNRYVSCVKQISIIEAQLGILFGSNKDRPTNPHSSSCDSAAAATNDRRSDDTYTNHEQLDRLLMILNGCFATSSALRTSHCGSLVRLHNEVATFHRKALSDTDQTMSKLMKIRLQFRASLAWLKELSADNLDPEVPQTLRRYRQVQELVKLRKENYDRMKSDASQKIDMLCASRCNMFSNVLRNYCEALLLYWKSMHKPLTHILQLFQSSIQYRFITLKQLNGLSQTSQETLPAPPPKTNDQLETSSLPPEMDLIDICANNDREPDVEEEDDEEERVDQCDSFQKELEVREKELWLKEFKDLFEDEFSSRNDLGEFKSGNGSLNNNDYCIMDMECETKMDSSKQISNDANNTILPSHFILDEHLTEAMAAAHNQSKSQEQFQDLILLLNNQEVDVKKEIKDDC